MQISIGKPADANYSSVTANICFRSFLAEECFHRVY